MTKKNAKAAGAKQKASKTPRAAAKGKAKARLQASKAGPKATALKAGAKNKAPKAANKAASKAKTVKASSKASAPLSPTKKKTPTASTRAKQKAAGPSARDLQDGNDAGSQTLQGAPIGMTDDRRMRESGAAASGYHAPTRQDLKDLRKNHETSTGGTAVNADEFFREKTEAEERTAAKPE